MFRSKTRSSLRNKSSSLLTLNEIENRDKSNDWRKNYQIKPKEIGRGHFSKVYHVTCDNRGQSFAAKVIRRRKGGIDRLNKIREEAALIRRLNVLGVQSVIQLYETYETFSDVVLISELAKGGSLFKLVNESDSNLNPHYVKVVTYKLLFALEAMHKENIVHLDIKADNILLREPYPSTDIALCDFGLATQLKEGKCHKELVGTPDYMAPEVINYEKVTVNADMWSVGVVVYYLLTGLSPFMGKSKDETLVNVSKVNISFDDIFEEADYSESKDFILSLCVKCPELRLSSTTAQRHSWFMNIEDINLDFPCEDHNMNCEVNMSDYSEDEITRIREHQRCQSVDFTSLNMLSINSGYRSLGMKRNSYSTNSCENLSTDAVDLASPSGTLNHKSLPKKLMNVEEVNDEAVTDSSSYNSNGTFPDNVKDQNYKHINGIKHISEGEEVNDFKRSSSGDNSAINMPEEVFETFTEKEEKDIKRSSSGDNSATNIPEDDFERFTEKEEKDKTLSCLSDCVLKNSAEINVAIKESETLEENVGKCHVTEDKDIGVFFASDITVQNDEVLLSTDAFKEDELRTIQYNSVREANKASLMMTGDRVMIATSRNTGLLIETLDDDVTEVTLATDLSEGDNCSELFVNICTYDHADSDNERPVIYSEKNCDKDESRPWSVFDLCTLC